MQDTDSIQVQCYILDYCTGRPYIIYITIIIIIIIANIPFYFEIWLLIHIGTWMSVQNKYENNVRK